jgi:GR25 family glycosyltransferase involved in LPS biosynthesis
MQFPHILIINLQHRIDRWESIRQQLNKEHLPYERVDAVKHKEGWKGASLSHQKAVRIAKERKYPWVLVLEDDCLFIDGWKKRFEELLPILWQRRKEWEVFTGGSYVVHRGCKILDNPPLYQVSAWSSHFVLIHEGTYSRILRHRLGVAMDDAFKRRYRMWCTYPHLAIQTGGWSDVRQHQNKISNFKDHFEKQNKRLKTIKKRCVKLIHHRRANMVAAYKKVRKTRKARRSQ